MAKNAAARCGTVLVLAHGRQALWKLCSRTLLERLAIQFAGLGAETIVISAPPELAAELRSSGAPEGVSWRVHDEGLGPIDPADLGAGDRVVVAAAQIVADERLLRAALGARAPTLFAHGDQLLPLATLAPDRVGPVTPDLFSRIAEDPAVKIVDIRSLPGFWLAQRRILQPYCLEIGDRAALLEAERVVVDAAGKGHQEWPVIVFNRPLETFLSHLLCRTRVTPNQLTALSVIAGLAAAGLVAAGLLLAGLAMAVAHAVIDGLDGRQARTQLRFSAFGELEHTADKVIEFAMVIALGWYLSGPAGDLAPLYGAIIWVAVIVADNLSGSWFRERAGFLPDLASPFDAAVRLIAPRRNTNIVYLALAGGAGVLDRAFWVLIALSIVTALLHWTRAVRLARRLPIEPWLARVARTDGNALIDGLFSVPPLRHRPRPGLGRGAAGQRRSRCDRRRARRPGAG